MDVRRNRPAREAINVLGHFNCFVAAKIRRALSGLAEDVALDSERHDSNGSAKAALVGLDRMRDALHTLVENGYAALPDVRPLIEETSWLIEQTETHLPGARAFVRPAFDEPDEVRHLEATEGGGLSR